MSNPFADIELVVSGVRGLRDGITEKERLEMPLRYKMFVAHTESANYVVGDQPVVASEFAIALEMAKVRQLDRIADLLEQLVEMKSERRK